MSIKTYNRYYQSEILENNNKNYRIEQLRNWEQYVLKVNLNWSSKSWEIEKDIRHI